VFGSVAAEVAYALGETIKCGGAVPAIYKKPFYLGARFLLVFVAGGLPVLLGATNGLTSFYLGVTAPLVLNRMQRSIEPPHGGAG
jgi:hypothetical protein